VGIDRVVGARSQLSGHPLARQRMNIFTRLLGGVPKEDRGGIRLAEPQPWEVSPTKDVERFLRALPLLAPVGTNVYFEEPAKRMSRSTLKELRSNLRCKWLWELSGRNQTATTCH
jgi:hypothetical protein